MKKGRPGTRGPAPREKPASDPPVTHAQAGLAPGVTKPTTSVPGLGRAELEVSAAPSRLSGGGGVFPGRADKRPGPAPRRCRVPPPQEAPSGGLSQTVCAPIQSTAHTCCTWGSLRPARGRHSAAQTPGAKRQCPHRAAHEGSAGRAGDVPRRSQGGCCAQSPPTHLNRGRWPFIWRGPHKLSEDRGEILNRPRLEEMPQLGNLSWGPVSLLPRRWPVGRFRMWFRKGLLQHRGQGSQTSFCRGPLSSHEILREVRHRPGMTEGWTLGATPAGKPCPRPDWETTPPPLPVSQEN